MLAVHGRKTVAALSRAIWERKARTMPTKKVGNVPGLLVFQDFLGRGQYHLFCKEICLSGFTSMSLNQRSQPGLLFLQKLLK